MLMVSGAQVSPVFNQSEKSFSELCSVMLCCPLLVEVGTSYLKVTSEISEAAFRPASCKNICKSLTSAAFWVVSGSFLL